MLPYSFDLLALETVQSQYGASEHMVKAVRGIAAYFDPQPDIDLFYTMMFDPKTAIGIGLDIWGRIVGIDRKIYVDNTDYFGFFGSELFTFDNAPFYSDTAPQGVTDLEDEAFRWLIFYKALANISSEDIATSNNLLISLMQNFTPSAQCFVLETNPMEVRVVFLFYLKPFERAVFEQYGLLNKSAGVGTWLQEIEPQSTFGFDGSGLQPFNQGIFDPYGVVNTADILRNNSI